MATYYVRKTGSDSNAGTSAGAAKLTIQAAVNLATTAGDIVYVGAGTYRETVTLAASGSSGNPIQIIGDYSGAQTGDAGVVRITGSDNDSTGTRAYCITATGRAYNTIKRVLLDGYTTYGIRLLGACTNCVVDQCYLDLGSGDSTTNMIVDGDTQGAVTVSNCVIVKSRFGSGGIWYVDGTGAGSGPANAGHVIRSCVFIGGADNAHAVNDRGVGGVTVSNCYVLGGVYGVRVTVMPAGYTALTVNNSLFEGLTYALHSGTSGHIVENYNRFWACAVNRNNVSTGANSLTGPPLHDRRWFFQMVGGGSVVTPYDLASYSTSVELNSGTGAPSTDARGASVKGSFREWGPLEYDSTLSTSGGSALGLPVVGSAIVRGVG